jgi:riboflavin synthase
VFTGIIEELGNIRSLVKTSGGALIEISARTVTEATATGDSISVNGVCLTALNVKNDGFSADVSQETLDRSTLGGLTSDSRVNLERAVTPSTRLGGHIVQGHVDGRGKLISAVENGGFWTVKIGFPHELAQYFVYKGSVSVEGISLTIAKLNEADFEIAVIPKTWELTNLSTLNSGDEVNLEADVIAKYVERIMQIGNSTGVKIETLKNHGFA